MPDLKLRSAIEDLLLEFSDVSANFTDEEGYVARQSLRISLGFQSFVDRITALVVTPVARAETPKQGEPGFTMDEVVEGGDHVEN